ncbi:MAG: peptidoglycan-binding domain-containing protein [Terrimicrobiaceae bacterium]
MDSLLAHWLRLGVFILISTALSGCAVEMGGYPPAQSMEAAVQTVLAKQGYYQGPIDGAIGPSTSRAIRAYQRDNRLTPTGTINPALLLSMRLARPQTANYLQTPYYTGYPAYYPVYAPPVYYTQPAVIGLGWGGGWPTGNCWGNGYRGYGGNGYRGGWYNGGNYGRGYGGYNNRGWCR